MVAGTLVLAGCGGGDDGPTPEEIARMEAEKQAAMELAEASAAIEAANEAAVMLDSMSDAAAVAAVEALITTAETEIGDLPAADQADATAMLAAARAIVAQANERLRIAAEAEAAAIQAAADAEAAAKAAADAATAAAEAKAEEEAQARADAMAAEEARQAAQAVSDAINEAIMLDGMSDAAAVEAVEALIATANAEIDDLPAADQDAHQTTLAAAQALVDAQNERLTAAAREAEQERQAAAEKAAAEAAKAAAEMAALAAKLHAGISAPNAATGATQRLVARSGTGEANITVSFNDPQVSQELTPDKMAMVAALHGWEGKRYTASGTGVDGTYEAIEYSNVGAPTPGDPFDEEHTGIDATTGELVIDTTAATNAARVASSSFDQSAGVKTFKLGENAARVVLSGSYHGVSGTYYCLPAGDTICASRVAADGFELGTVASATDSTFTAGSTGWNFKPSNPKARVMSTPDAIYASYGWWIHKSADDKTYTASAYAVDKGAVPDASGITALRGTATYSGGAAGKYALYSSTGGTNDAGHFTADAMLNADFNDDTVTGTIDNFTGADGMMRNWSVKLNESTVSDTGGIAGDPATAGNTDAQMTVWTIDGTAAAAAGAWSGSLQDNGDDGVPKVGTGTFTSSYSTSGEMVGGFGVNKQ